MLDFYRAATDHSPRPCVVVIHGGSWLHGNRLDDGTKRWLNDWLARHGYAVASIDYRLAPEFKWPAQRDDVFAAIKFLRAHAAALGIDGDRLVLLGRSAGGQMATAAAYAEVWEVKWIEFWRKVPEALSRCRHCLIVARNVLTGEVKYFVANRCPGHGGVTVRWLLRAAFARWNVEACFREAKEELGMDHYEVRGWRCLHRHFYLTQLSHLFCAVTRKEYDQPTEDGFNVVSMEQVRRAVNVCLNASCLTNEARTQCYRREKERQDYHQQRNAQARWSHHKSRIDRLRAIGIDPDRIKSCLNAHPPSPPK